MIKDLTKGMKRTIIVNVDEWCIEHGRASSCQNCPVALAIGRHVIPPLFVKAVHSDWVIRRHINYEEHYAIGVIAFGAMPDNARQFIRKFDDDEKGDPFEFRVDVEGDWFYDVT